MIADPMAFEYTKSIAQVSASFQKPFAATTSKQNRRLLYTAAESQQWE